MPSPMVCVVGFGYLFRLLLMYLLSTKCTKEKIIFAFIYSSTIYTSIQSDESKIFSYIPNSIKQSLRKKFLYLISLHHFKNQFNITVG